MVVSSAADRIDLGTHERLDEGLNQRAQHVGVSFLHVLAHEGDEVHTGGGGHRGDSLLSLLAREGPHGGRRSTSTSLQAQGDSVQYTTSVDATRETSRAAITTVFEHVNTGGLKLNAFKLLTATFAGERTYQERHGHDFRLAEDWKEITEQLGKLAALRELKSNEFL
jgi:hypothetical protein